MKKTSGDTEEDQKKSDQREVQTLTNSYLMVDPNKLNGVLPRLYNFTDYNQFSRPTDDIDISTGLPAPSGAALPDPIINKHIQLPDGNATVTALGWAATGEQDSGLSRLGVNDYAYYVNGSLVTEWLSAEFRVNYLTAGQVAFPDTNKKITGNASFSWDDSSTFLKLTSTAGKQIRLAYDASNLEDITIDSAGRIAITPGLWKISQSYTNPLFLTTAVTFYFSETGISVPANRELDVFRFDNTLEVGAASNASLFRYNLAALSTSDATSDLYAVIGEIKNYGPGIVKALYGRVTGMPGSTGSMTAVNVGVTPGATSNSSFGVQVAMDSTSQNVTAALWLMSNLYPSSTTASYGLLIDQTIQVQSVGYQMFAGGPGDFLKLMNAAGTAALYRVLPTGYLEIGTNVSGSYDAVICGSTTTETINRFSADVLPPTLRFEKMRSSAGAADVVGDFLGSVEFFERNATPAWVRVAQISAAAQGIAAGNESGVLLFNATVAGTAREFIRLGDVTGIPTAGVTVNEASASIFFKVRGVTAASLFVVDGGTDRISSTVSDALTTPTYNFIQSSTGDASIRFSIGTTNSWAIGADNSDSDSFKVSWLGSGSAILGTNDYFTITIGGLLLGNISNSLTSPHLELIQASTGDSATRWTLTGANSFIAGIDNSDADKWKLSYGSAANAALGTNDYITVTVAGAVSMAGLSVSSLTDSGLTSGRVTFASTAGLLADDAGFTFDGVTLTLSDSNAATTPLVIINQASTGDSALRFTLATTASYIIGIDNSDSDKWKVSYAASGTAALGTGDYLTIGTDGEMIAVQWLQVGTATDAATQGDFVTGLTAAARLFYDQSVPALYSYDSSGNIVNQQSAVAATATVWNEQGADIDFRIEGDTKANLFFVDASTDRVGVNQPTPGVRFEVLDTSQQLRLSYDGSNSCDFQVLSTGGIIVTPTGALFLLDHNADNDYQCLIRNQSNTSAAQAYLEVRVAGGTAGDPFVIVEVDAGNSYSMGLDNSDADSFKISYGSAANARPGTNDFLNMKTTGSVAVAKPSLGTTATDGFLYVPTCAGTPTGVPSTITGYAPVVVDTTNNRWYFYSTGAWRNAGP